MFVGKNWLESRPYRNGIVMRIVVPIVLRGVSVFVRSKKLAPKFFVKFFGGSEVERKTHRIVEALEGTFKVIKGGICSNSGHIQVMKLVY